jgi:hypothetical protein
MDPPAHGNYHWPGSILSPLRLSHPLVLIKIFLLVEVFALYSSSFLFFHNFWTFDHWLKCVQVVHIIWFSSSTRWSRVLILANQRSERVVRIEIHFDVFSQLYLSLFFMKLVEIL